MRKLQTGLNAPTMADQLVKQAKVDEKVRRNDISVRLNKEAKAKADALARHSGTNRAQAVRAAIDHQFNRTPSLVKALNAEGALPSDLYEARALAIQGRGPSPDAPGGDPRYTSATNNQRVGASLGNNNAPAPSPRLAGSPVASDFRRDVLDEDDGLARDDADIPGGDSGARIPTSGRTPRGSDFTSGALTVNQARQSPSNKRLQELRGQADPASPRVVRKSLVKQSGGLKQAVEYANVLMASPSSAVRLQGEDLLRILSQ